MSASSPALPNDDTVPNDWSALARLGHGPRLGPATGDTLDALEVLREIEARQTGARTTVELPLRAGPRTGDQLGLLASEIAQESAAAARPLRRPAEQAAAVLGRRPARRGGASPVPPAVTPHHAITARRPLPGMTRAGSVKPRRSIPMLKSLRRLPLRFAVGVAAVAVMAGGATAASAVAGGAASAAVTPLAVTLSADGNGTAVFNGSGDPVLTIGSTGTYAQMAVSLAAGSVAPSEAPTFSTDNYNAGSPRWVIALSNGDYLDSNQTGAAGAANGWEYDSGSGWMGYGDTYAQALAVVDADNAVHVTNAYIVEDGDQTAGTPDTLTNVQYGGQTLPGTVTVTSPGAQSWTVGKAATLQVEASTDTSDTTLAYTATSLPAGLSINASTGLISGTPTAAESYSTTVTATDAYGDTASQTFTWATVNPPACTGVTGNHQASTTAPAGLQASPAGSRENLSWTMPCDVTGAAWSTSIWKGGQLMDTKVVTSPAVFYGVLVKGDSYTVRVRWNDPNSPYSTVTFIAA